MRRGDGATNKDDWCGHRSLIAGGVARGDSVLVRAIDKRSAVDHASPVLTMQSSHLQRVEGSNIDAPAAEVDYIGRDVSRTQEPELHDRFIVDAAEVGVDCGWGCR